MGKKKTYFRNTLCLLLVSCAGSMAVVAEDRTAVIDMTAPVKAVVGELEFRECRVSSQAMERNVQCAWYEVAENPQAENAKIIKLFVVRLPAKRHVKHVNDPVLFISGGPGQAASETFLFADKTWGSLAKNRDFYLIDQRGTGYSNYMGCDEFLEDEQLFNTDYDSEKLQQLTLDCIAAMPGDVRYYTTDISVQDFDNVRVALGISKWNIFGVSYGTRVATHYMRTYPDSLRTVVLDSVVPPQYILGSEAALRSQQVLDVLFNRCEKNSLCVERMPDLRQNVSALLTALEESPVTIKVENLRSGAIEDFTFTRDHLVVLIRMYLYSPHTLALLPPMLHEAARNSNYSAIARAANSTLESLTSSISFGLSNSVMCTEEYPYYKQISEAVRSANRDAYMGMVLIEHLQDLCSVWPRGKAIPIMKDPLVSDIPSLLLSGEYDPITPPEYADQTLKTLGNGRHLVLEGQGHFVSSIGCIPHLIEEFVTDASADTLTIGCLDRINTAPLYLNFNGAAP